MPGDRYVCNLWPDGFRCTITDLTTASPWWPTKYYKMIANILKYTCSIVRIWTRIQIHLTCINEQCPWLMFLHEKLKFNCPTTYLCACVTPLTFCVAFFHYFLWNAHLTYRKFIFGTIMASSKKKKICDCR